VIANVRLLELLAAEMSRYLQLAKLRQEVDEETRQRADELEQNGLKAIDALHVLKWSAVVISLLVTSV
jgi:GAF domain-containing protein